MIKQPKLIAITIILSLLVLATVAYAISIGSDLDFQNQYKILNLPTTGYPANDSDAATKAYVDSSTSGNLSVSTVTTTDGLLYLNDTGQEGNIYQANYIYGYDDLHLWSDPGNNATIYLDATNQTINFYTQGTQRMSIDSSGNVTITGTISEGGTLLSNKYLLIPSSSIQGDILIRNASGWTRLPAGISGQVLQTQGVSSDPVWTDESTGLTGSGADTQIAFFTGIDTLSSDTNLTWDNTNKRLGLSSANPISTLDVNGNTVLSGRIQLGNEDTGWINKTIAGFSEPVVSNDTFLLVPGYTGTEDSDLRLYMVDNSQERFSIWGDSCGGGNCGELDNAGLKHYFTGAGTAYHSGNVGIGMDPTTSKLSILTSTGNVWQHDDLSGNIGIDIGQNAAGNVGSIKLWSYSAGNYVFLRPSNGNYHIDSTTGQYYYNWDEGVRGASNGVIHMANQAGIENLRLDTAGDSWINGHTFLGSTNTNRRLKISDVWTGYPNSTDGAEIAIDAGIYKAMMIVGSDQDNTDGRCDSLRCIRMWDRVTVEGELYVTGRIGIGQTNPGTWELYTTGQAYISDYLRADGGLTTDSADPGTNRLRVGDYAMILGGAHIGGTTDPGTDNLVVDGIIRAGTSVANSNYKIYSYRSSGDTGANKAAIYGFRYGASGVANGGTSWSMSGIDAAVKGYSYWGNQYTAGVAGYNYLDYNLSAGVIGARSGGTNLGALGFKDSSGTLWAGYFNGDVKVNGDLFVPQGGFSIPSYQIKVGSDQAFDTNDNSISQCNASSDEGRIILMDAGSSRDAFCACVKTRGNYRFICIRGI